MMKRTLTAMILSLAVLTAAAQQTDAQRKLAEQERVVARLRSEVEADARNVADIRKGRASAQKEVAGIIKQIESRNRLINATERKTQLLEAETRRADSAARHLAADLARQRDAYAEMTREAYRNYRHNNFISYVFASSSFEEVAHRLSMLRSVADLRRVKMQEIAHMQGEVAEQLEELGRRRSQLDSARRDLDRERRSLRQDEREARATAQKLSKKEKEALKAKERREQQLSVALDELRRLTKGNKEGSSFSAKTSNLRLPVEGGRVKRYNGNIAEVVGPKGARVVSIYDGKVVKITQNRITGKYDVYVAHGEYVSTYANLESVCVETGRTVARNGQLGVIGQALDVETMSTQYRMIFGIYAPTPGVQMKAANCFKK